MSAINFNINGGAGQYTMNTEQMRARLEGIKSGLNTAIEKGLGNPDVLQDRLNKVDSQIERLDRLAGENINITSQRAQMELARGAKLIEEGIRFTLGLRDNGVRTGRAPERLQNWLDHIHQQQGRLDTMG